MKCILVFNMFVSVFYIRCQVNIYWVKDEKIFKGARVHDDGSVFIRKVRLQDSGDYECYSKDEARLLFGSVKLKVIGMYIVFIFLFFLYFTLSC